MNKEQLVEGMTYLREAIPKIEVTDKTAFRALGHLDNDSFQKAVNSIVLDKNFKLYDNALGEIYDRAIKGDRVSAEEGWLEVLDQAMKVGYVGEPKFTNPTIRKAIDACGGWTQCCQDSSEYSKLRFKEAYNDFCDSNIERSKQGAEQLQDNTTPLNMLGDLTKDIG